MYVGVYLKKERSEGNEGIGGSCELRERGNEVKPERNSSWGGLEGEGAQCDLDQGVEEGGEGGGGVKRGESLAPQVETVNKLPATNHLGEGERERKQKVILFTALFSSVLEN